MQLNESDKKVNVIIGVCKISKSIVCLGYSYFLKADHLLSDRSKQ